jgi:hypothetical protein
LDLRGREWRRAGEDYMMRSFVTCTIHHMLCIREIKSMRITWAAHVERMGEMRNSYKTLVVNPERKRQLGRPRRRWKGISTK